MEIYLLIGVVYAFFNRTVDKGWIGFGVDVVVWPFEIMQNLSRGWNSAKLGHDHISKLNIKLCHDSMEELHNTIADTVLDVTGKGLSQQPDNIRTGMIIYEIQGILAAAKTFRINQTYHREIAITQLTSNGIPNDIAQGMIDAVLTSSDHTMEWTKDILDGEAGYEQLTLGVNALSEHVKETFIKLQSVCLEEL